MSNTASSNAYFLIPNSEGRPELHETGGHSRFTDKARRCHGHLRAKGYTDGAEYAICTASIGYAGTYNKEFRRGARTPAGRAKKVRAERA